MKLTEAEIAKSKDITCLGTWCLLHGPEWLLKQEALARLRAGAEARAGGELTWEVLDGRDLRAAEVLSRSQTGALFGGARIIVVREAERMDADQQDALAAAAGAALPAEVSVILLTGQEARTGPARGREVRPTLRRAIERDGLAIACRPLRVPEATRWAVSRAKKLGKRLEPAAAARLVQRVGTQLAKIEVELEKLALFVGAAKTIGASHVEEVSPPAVEEDIFRLVDAVRRRQVARAVTVLRALLYERREPPARIVWALAQAMRLVWQIKLMLERGWKPGQEPDEATQALLPQDSRKNALAQLKGKSWLVGPTCAQARSLSWARLARAIAALHACDLAVKGAVGAVDETLALELLVVQLATDLEMPVWAEAQ